MSDMITTPALHSITGHDLTRVETIIMSDADLYPDLQGQSLTARAVAYSVFCPATERYSLVTLDGRWIIPGRDGYKSRGPVKTYARKNVADVRPKGMRVLEPVRHDGPYAPTSAGRRSGTCRRQLDRATRGTGFDCTCGATVPYERAYRAGWTIVVDGRKGSHQMAYALWSGDGVEYGAEPCSYDAPVITGAAANEAAEINARTVAETRTVAPAAPAPVAETREDRHRSMVRGEALATATGYGADAATAERFAVFYLDGCYSDGAFDYAWGEFANGAQPATVTVQGPDAGPVVSQAEPAPAPVAPASVLLAPGVVQTPESAPEGTPDNARRLIAAGPKGRSYVHSDGGRLRIESADGRLAYTLPTVPDDTYGESAEAFKDQAQAYAAEVHKRHEGAPKWRKARLGMWSGKPQRAKDFEPAYYAPGTMIAWSFEGREYTAQVWANRVRGGAWNRDQGDASAVIIATVDGRRARRDEAVCLPLYYGKRRSSAPYAQVTCLPKADTTYGEYGAADVRVIDWQCASEGLFDVVSTAGATDPVDGWESEGGACAGVETPGPVTAGIDDLDRLDADTDAAPAAADVDRFDRPQPASEAAPAAPVGEWCPRCERDALYGVECSHCGHVDISAAMAPVACHPPAWSEGCCPTCYAKEPAELWEISGKLQCTQCAEGRSRWGDRVKAFPGWRDRSRRVLAWVDEPEAKRATRYAPDEPQDGPTGDRPTGDGPQAPASDLDRPNAGHSADESQDAADDSGWFAPWLAGERADGQRHTTDREPMGKLPKAWNDTLCDVARGQVHASAEGWRKVVRGYPGAAKSRKALTSLLALDLIAVGPLDTRGRAIVVLTTLGVARFDRHGPVIPERARSVAVPTGGEQPTGDGEAAGEPAAVSDIELSPPADCDIDRKSVV